MKNISLNYILKRLYYLFPMLILKFRFSKAGNNFLIEFPFKILNPNYISVGKRFRVFKGSRIECISAYGEQVFNPQLIIGNNVTINNNVHIGVVNKVIIEDNVLLASYVYISDHSHGDYGTLLNTNPNVAPSKREIISTGPVIIGENSWIGEGVKILPNVTIGKGCIVGANAVVSRNIPNYSIAAGVPAKVIKKFNFKKAIWETV